MVLYSLLTNLSVVPVVSRKSPVMLVDFHCCVLCVTLMLFWRGILAGVQAEE